jgi:site-specific DNA-adenine methylase
LICYAFNNDIRFNSAGKFNMPVGKTDFNGSIRKKLKSFKNGIQNKNICFEVADFEIVKNIKLGNHDFVYIDPPYLITEAVYNKSNTKEYNGWNSECEKRLLELLDHLNKNGTRFALSNILQKGNIKNNILLNWIKKNSLNIIDINYHYRASSYNKKHRNAKVKEVLITNYAKNSK